MKVKIMIWQALIGAKRRRESQMAEIAQKTVVDRLKKCVEEKQQGAVQSKASLSVRLIIKWRHRPRYRCWTSAKDRHESLRTSNDDSSRYRRTSKREPVDGFTRDDCVELRQERLCSRKMRIRTIGIWEKDPRVASVFPDVKPCVPRWYFVQREKKKTFWAEKSSARMSNLSARAFDDDRSSGSSHRMSWADEETTSYSTVHMKKDHAACLQVSRPLKGSFVEAVDYLFYHLKNKSQRYYSKITVKIARLEKKLRSQLKETGFNEMDPI